MNSAITTALTMEGIVDASPGPPKSMFSSTYTVNNFLNICTIKKSKSSIMDSAIASTVDSSLHFNLMYSDPGTRK